MRLADYIRQVGPAKFAKAVRVKERTVLSWLYRARHPNRATALKIVKKTPVTMEGIYGV